MLYSFLFGFLCGLGCVAGLIYYILVYANRRLDDKIQSLEEINKSYLSQLPTERLGSPLPSPIRVQASASISSTDSLSSLPVESSPNSYHPHHPKGLIRRAFSSKKWIGTSTAPQSPLAMHSPQQQIQSLIEGNIQIQFGGKKSTLKKYKCFIQSHYIHFKRNSALSKSNLTSSPDSPIEDQQKKKFESIDLTGCYYKIEKLGTLEHAIELSSPTKKIIGKFDYLYLILNNEREKYQWVEVLKVLHLTVPTVTESYKNHNFTKESSDWLNVLVKRILLNIKDSQETEEKLKRTLAKILTTKVKEKALDTMLTNIVCESVKFSEDSPRFDNWQVNNYNSKGLTDLACDLQYLGEIQIVVSLSIYIDRMGLNFVLPLIAQICIKSVTGKLRLYVEEYPSEKVEFAFYELPVLRIDITSKLNEKKNVQKKHLNEELLKLLNSMQINELLKKLINLKVLEKLVLPNRKCVKIPGKSSGSSVAVANGDLMNASVPVVSS